MRYPRAVSTFVVRRAEEADLPAIVALYRLPDGNTRDREAALDPFAAPYVDALRASTDDNAAWVADEGGAVCGVFQLTFVRHVAFAGGLVAQIEAVVVAEAARGRGVGEAMMRFAIAHARSRGAFRVQLTSNKARTRAHAFYERLGFVRTHEGMKLVF